MATSAASPAYVLGVGMTQFIKPRGKVTYYEMGFEAGVKAMLDAHINYDDVEMGLACYCYGDSTSGQRVFYQFGMTAIPVLNINNNCATGSSGLFMARKLIQGGTVDCVLVVGFEQMRPGMLRSNWPDRPSPTGLIRKMGDEIAPEKSNSPPNAQIFGNAAREYMAKYGAEADDFAEIARVNHDHSGRNPYSQFREKYSLEGIRKSDMIYAPLTKLQCCPTSDGAAAAVIVSQRFLDARPHLRDKAVLIAGQHCVTDSPKLFSRSAIELVGFDMSKQAARVALAEARASPRDVKICELHDCFSANELLTLDALGLCEPGKAHEMVRNGDITYGGRVVVNPSGGLISKGHPLGATGLAQCAELVWHLRGWATNRLVSDLDVALQHNLGLGGAVVVTVYRRADGQRSSIASDRTAAQSSGLGYNPAVEARKIQASDADKVRSRRCRVDWALGDTQQRIDARL
ncbi:hypothetical protein AYO21_07978 [Fonsecaea monophora]|uniref:propanoyl-CoA C-acyltransferase n=1 Tax=Fonsecaea monophora TaxID=254056 RepID=A0A177F3J5_9EURO|nr:hypothetical protein AYO21_07978 [Fonsecaea monophora]OAG37872.1 hypothetical protein AYO21_07978 [Fonsecaea monophora]